MKLTIRYLIGSALAAAVIAVLAAEVDVGRSLRLISSVSPRVILAAMAIYIAAHGFRALRFGSVLGEDAPSFLCLFSIVSIHNLLNQVMPVRTGEGAYPLLAKKVGGISYSKGVSSLLLVRTYDLAAFFTIFVLSLIYTVFKDSSLWLRALSISAAALAAYYAFRHLGRVAVMSMRAVKQAVGFMRLGSVLGMDIGPAMEKLVAGLDSAHRAGNTGRLTFYSLLVWMTTYLMFYVFVAGIRGGVGFMSSVIGSSGAVLTGLLPVNTLGSVGTLEGGWLAGFLAVGLDRESALASGLLMHAFVIVFGLLLSLAGLLYLKSRHG